MNTQTLNTILICLFAFVISLALLAGLIGFIKGIYKTTLKTIVKAILITILVFVSPYLANALGSINIQNFVKSEIAISLQTYVANLITDTGLFSPVNAISVYSTTFAIANSLLSFAVFLFGMIIIQLFASLLSGLIYNGIFKWFLPVENKKQRKKRKSKKKEDILSNGLFDDDGSVIEKSKHYWRLLRIPGAIVGALQEFVFVVILLCPISSLCSIGLKNREAINDVLITSDIDENTIKEVNSYMDVVSSSLIYKTTSLFSIDNVIMDNASKVNIYGNNVSFNSLVSSLFDVANPLIKDKTISYNSALDSVTINYSALLSISSIDGIIDNLISNPTILSLLPPLLEMALNTFAGNYVATDNFNLTNIDWSNELSSIKDIYKEVYSLVEPMINGTKFEYNNFKIETSKFTDEDIDRYVNALGELGKLESVKRNMPVIFSSIGVYLNNIGYDVFSTNSKDYDNVDWSKDLASFGNIILRFFRLINVDITSKLNLIQIKDNLLTTLKDEEKRNQIKAMIVSNENMTGILDTDLYSTISLSNILNSTLSSIPALKEYLEGIDINEVLKDKSLDEYKNEMNTMFDMLDILFSEDSKIDLENLSSFDLEDEEAISQVVSLLKVSQKSSIFNQMYPKVVKAMLFLNEYDFSHYLYGLTPYNFNYDDSNFISDFIEVLQLLPEIEKMRSTFNDETLSTADKLLSFDTDLMKRLLTIITGSGFFNADQRTGVNSLYQKNINIHTFISNFFSNKVFTSIGITTPSINDFQSINWISSSSEKGEIDSLCEIFDDAKKNAKYLTSNEKDVKDIEDSSAMADMIVKGMDSKLISPSVLNIIDNSLNQYLKEMGITFDFNSLRNGIWKEDENNIVDLIDILRIFDFKNIDFKNLDANKFNALLTTLYKMNILQEQNYDNYQDKFGYVLYKLINKFKTTTIDVEFDDPSMFQVETLNNDDKWSVSTSSITIKEKINNKEVTNTFEITSDGEIKSLCDFIFIIQKEKYSSLKDSKLPTVLVDEISPLMTSKLLRKIVSRYLENVATKLQVDNEFSSFILSIDFSSFSSLTSTQAQQELELFSKIYNICNDKYDGENKIDYISSHIYSIKSCKVDESTTLYDELSEILNGMKSSALFNKKKDGYLYSPVLYFFKGFIKKSDMEEKITLFKDDKQTDSILDEILLNVKNTSNELDYLIKLIDLFDGQSDDFSFGKDSLSYEKASDIVELMNKSDIFYRYPISLMINIFNEKNINQYLVDPKTNNVVHSLDYYVHLTNQSSDKCYWKNDLDYLLKIVYEDNLNSFFEGDDTFDDLDIASYEDLNFIFLYHIGKMNLFSSSRSYLFYNLLDKASDDFDISSLFTSPSVSIYKENKQALRIEELFYTNTNLVNSNITIEEQNYKIETNIIKGIVTSLAKELKNLSTSEEINIDFEKEMNQVFYLKENDTLYRSSFSSEILAGAMREVFKNTKFMDTFSKIDSSTREKLKSFSFYENDHYYINPLEGRGINALLELSNLTKSLSLNKTYFTYGELNDVFSLLGVEDISSTSNTKLSAIFFNDINTYNQISNSKIVMVINDFYKSLPVLKVNENVVTTLDDVVSDVFNLNSISLTSYQKLFETNYKNIIQ